MRLFHWVAPAERSYDVVVYDYLVIRIRCGIGISAMWSSEPMAVRVKRSVVLGRGLEWV